ncbi:MAG: heme-binding protein [Coraliomargarita sp.]
MKLLNYLCICLLPLQPMTAYEQAFPKTGVNQIELKTLPAAKLIASKTDSPYFERNNSLFRPLFRYIQDNDIAMTTPVEAEMAPGVMYFYIGGDAAKRELAATDDVHVLELPERTVASIGVRGAYTEARFDAAKDKLEEWLRSQGTHTATGPARGIYWNGPFTLGLLKRAEVHIPVAPISDD